VAQHRENQQQQRDGDSGCLVLVLLDRQQAARHVSGEAILRIREADK
jgi:hypothetical protein